LHKQTIFSSPHWHENPQKKEKKNRQGWRRKKIVRDETTLQKKKVNITFTLYHTHKKYIHTLI